MHRITFLNALALLAFLASPAVPLLAAQVPIPHPDAANLRSRGPELIVSRSSPAGLSTELARYATLLRRGRIKDSVGTLDGDPVSVFGLIRDVTVAESGEIFVLDRSNRAVRVFDLNGRHRLTVGRDGSGPTDLRTPVAAWANSKTEFVVFDASLGTKFFSRDESGRITLKRSVPASTAASAACGSSSSTSLMLMPRSDHPDSSSIVHTFDQSGRTKAKFGSGYRSSTSLVRAVMSEGQLGCLRSGDVLIALVKLPTVTAYDSRGNQKFTVRFQDFVIGRHLEQRIGEGRASIGLDPSRPTASTILQIREIFQGFATVQIGLMTPKSLKDRTIWERIDTYLIEMKSGASLFVSSDLPLLGGANGSTLVGFVNDPYPRVLMYSLF